MYQIPNLTMDDHTPESADEQFYQLFDEDELQHLQWKQAVWLIVIVCLSLLGNIGVLISLSLRQHSSKPSRLTLRQLLTHMCIGDLSYALFTMLPRTVNIFTFPRFYGGSFLCRLVKFLQLIPLYVCSFLVLVCCVVLFTNTRRNLMNTNDPHLSLDNRRRISWRASHSFGHVLSFWAWITGFMLSAPNILAFRFEYLDRDGTIGACVPQIRVTYERIWLMFLTGATWIVPLTLVVVLYMILYVKLAKKSNSNARIRKMHNEHEETRLLNFFASITFLKFILWTPFNIMNILGSYWVAIQIAEDISTGVTLAANFTCIVPPFVYFLFEMGRIKNRIRKAWMRYTHPRKRQSVRIKAMEPTALHLIDCNPTQIDLIDCNLTQIDRSHESPLAVPKIDEEKRSVVFSV